MAASRISYQIYMLLGMMTRRLDDHNFITWRYQFQTLLEGQDLFGYVDGNTLCPTKYVITDDDGVTIEITTTCKEWKKTDKAILSLLIATLSFDVMDYVVGSETSREAWMRLNDRYVINSRTHVMQLKNDLYAITKGMDSVEKYLLKVIRARNQLFALGERMEDEDIVIVILNGLPAGFNLLKAIIRARETPIAISEVRILLLAAERDIARRAAPNTVSAFSVTRTHEDVSQGYLADNGNVIRNKASNGGGLMDYFEPSYSLTPMTEHNTTGTESSGVSTCVQDISFADNPSDIHVGASPAIVDRGELITINNDKVDIHDDLGHVKAKGDDTTIFYAVAVDDIKCFNSEDDQFCDCQQQLEKIEDDNNSKMVMKLESLIIDEKKVAHCSLMEEMEKLGLKFNPQAVDISYSLNEGKFDFILKYEGAILISKVLAESHGHGPLVEVDLSSISIRRVWARLLTHVAVDNVKLLPINGHFIYANKGLMR